MKAISEDSKNIVFYQGDAVAGKLTFAGWHSPKASLTDKTGNVFKIGPTNIFRHKINVILDQQCLLSIHRKWTGVSKIHFSKDSEGQWLTFLRKGFFKGRYVLKDKDDRELAVARLKFRVKKLRHDFEIEISDILKRRANSFLLVAIMIYLMRIKSGKAAY
ncbi:MAG: hypothetical protein RBR28_14685 [Lentimicrobium sp.]|jgi:hypothetical protein|nr:hypothetical protein [Lentimicrobium sp.]